MTGEADPCFVDTNVLVYAHDIDAKDKHEQARALMRELWESGRGGLSIQVLQEFFVTVTRKIPNPLDIDAAADAVEDYAHWALHTPTAIDVLDAVAIHRRHQISFWDAMIINSAARLACSIVYTEDLNDGQQFDGLVVRNPFR
jgi:predicted nucleic acid-binding protein